VFRSHHLPSSQMTGVPVLWLAGDMAGLALTVIKAM